MDPRLPVDLFSDGQPLIPTGGAGCIGDNQELPPGILLSERFKVILCCIGYQAASYTGAANLTL